MRSLAVLAPSPRRGEGWGEGERGGAERAASRSGYPHPTLSRRERALVVAGVQEFGSDGFEDAFDVFDDLVVPEAEDCVAGRFDLSRASGVSDAVSMLPAVEFDHQPCFDAGEVGDIGADQELAAEFCVFDLPGAQALPQDPFDFGCIPAQSPGYRRQSLLQCWNPSPNPLPMGEGYKALAQ